MSDMNDDQDPSLLAAGYALGTHTPEEMAAYAVYLAGSADGRRGAEAFEQTAAALGMDAAPVTPRPKLKTDLLTLIQTTQQEEPADGTSPTGAEESAQ